jgi:hypothetical protein
MISRIRNIAKKNLLFRKFIGYTLASSGLFDSYFRNYAVSPVWKKRIDHVLSSTDNDFIPKVPDAGKISRGRQVMHNGIKIHLGSYYGPEYSKMLVLSKGVHEPQEERIFMEALKTIPQGSLMVEMGAFWSFYSMWFQKEIKQAVNFMVEPDSFNMGQGKRNFRLNKMKGLFIQAFVGRISTSGKHGNTVCVDDLVKKHAISFIHMLHSDIQGFEYEMLLGAEITFSEDKVGYVFISTHSNELHYQCLNFLKNKNFVIIASADLDESFSEDGLIAARAPSFKGINAIHISKRSQ